MWAWQTLVLLFFLTSNVSLGRASNCSYSELLEYLKLNTTNDFLATVRPVKDWKEVTVVAVDMLLYGILQVDSKLQIFTSHIWTQIVWKNDFLTWTPSDFCGITHLSVPRSKLWTPDIGIQEDTSDTGSITKSSYVTVYSSGLLQITARQRLSSTCTLNLFAFPFDRQDCDISFSPMNTHVDSMQLQTFSGDQFINNVSDQILLTRGEWTLKKLDIFRNDTSTGHPHLSKVIYKVKLERKPMLYVINFIIPLFYLLTLDLASFFIDEARGEKLSFKITILLAISVLLLLLQDMLPSTEDNLPLIANFCIGVFALVGLSVLEAMLVSFLIDLDDKFCKNPARKTGQDVRSDKQEMKDVVKEKEEEDPVQVIVPSEREQLKLFLEEVRAAQQKAASAGDVPQRKCFRRIAKIIDLVYFVVYLITVTVFLVVMYNVWIPPDFFS
ncbi:5-hydroxytryptamine receptor 3A [Stigmatopora argus]